MKSNRRVLVVAPALTLILGALLLLFVLAHGAVAPAGLVAQDGGISALAQSTNWSDISEEVLTFHDVTLAQLDTFSKGYPDGTWRPFEVMSRAQLTAVAVTLYEIPLANPSTATYTDVPTGNPLYQYIEGATAAGFVSGVAPGVFEPSGTVMRQGVVALVVRWAETKKGYDLASIYTDNQVVDYAGTFKDYADPTHGSNVHLADDNGLLVGLVVTGDPGAWIAGNATRGEVAQVLSGLMQLRTDRHRRLGRLLVRGVPLARVSDYDVAK